MEKTFISTSIAYLNAEPHIGFLFELIGADVLARYYRQKGEDVFFLTGTDEHGIKVAQAIETAGVEGQVYVDKLANKFKEVSADFNISFDHFVRTTDKSHVEFVQEVWKKLAEAKIIERHSYEGWYCTGCEAFKTEREIVDGKCAIHEKPLEKIIEENYFLLITEPTKDKIREWLSTAIKPENRQAEVLHMLDDINEVSISRPKDKLSWGIPVPGDEAQTMYVWVDALSNYLSGIIGAGKKIEEYWPGLQLIGKDIVKFHAVIWPAILIALGYDLPKQLLVHGWINIDGKKISKSKGNVITPAELKDRYGVEASRYLLLRQLNFYEDSNFVWREFDALYNGELANGVGNLVARVVGLLKKINRPIEKEIDVASEELSLADFAGALNAINREINDTDKTISEFKLWENITEDKEKQEQLVAVGEKVVAIADLLAPFTPETSKEIHRQLKELDSKSLFPRLK